MLVPELGTKEKSRFEPSCIARRCWVHLGQVLYLLLMALLAVDVAHSDYCTVEEVGDFRTLIVVFSFLGFESTGDVGNLKRKLED